MNQAQGAKELVQRARAGEQNAMAILDMVGRNAKHGDPKAVSAHALILEYIRKKPIKHGGTIGSEVAKTLGVLRHNNPIEHTVDALTKLPSYADEDAINAACVLLANGAPLNKSKVKTVDSFFQGQNQAVFRFGYSFSSEGDKLGSAIKQLDGKGMGVLCAGHCIGTARKIQLARLSNVPVSVLGSDIAWEIGC